MQKVKDKETFLKAVRAIASHENAGIFHSYVCGDILKISTAKKEMEFDFSSFDSDKEIINYIQSAIDILREYLPQQILLFDEDL